MVERHTITAVGLLKDVDFHVVKGAAQVFGDSGRLFFNVQYRLTQILRAFPSKATSSKRTRRFLRTQYRRPRRIRLGQLYRGQKEGERARKAQNNNDIRARFYTALCSCQMKNDSSCRQYGFLQRNIVDRESENPSQKSTAQAKFPGKPNSQYEYIMYSYYEMKQQVKVILVQSLRCSFQQLGFFCTKQCPVPNILCKNYWKGQIYPSDRNGWSSHLRAYELLWLILISGGRQHPYGTMGTCIAAQKKKKDYIALLLGNARTYDQFHEFLLQVGKCAVISFPTFPLISSQFPGVVWSLDYFAGLFEWLLTDGNLARLPWLEGYVENLWGHGIREALKQQNHIQPMGRAQKMHELIILFHNIAFAKIINPFTPKSDQCQNSPPASPEILHHTVWRTWLFIAYSDEKWLYYKFSLHHSYNRFLKGWEDTLFELRSERVKNPSIEKQKGIANTNQQQSLENY